MARKYNDMNLKTEDIKQLMNDSRNKEEFRRYQAVYLRVSQQMPALAIADITGFSLSHIYKIHSQCLKEGISSLSSRSKGGRYRSYLSLEEERTMLREIEGKAASGGVLEVSKVRKLFEEKVDREVALYTVYRLLHRNGWRKIAPRPYHPKQKADAVENFKKTGLIWWKGQD
jgi:transposase